MGLRKFLERTQANIVVDGDRSAADELSSAVRAARRPWKYQRFYRRFQKGCGWPAIWRCQIRTTAIDAASPLRDNFTTVDNSRRHYPADHGKGSDNSRPLGWLHRR